MKEYFRLIEETNDRLIFKNTNTCKGVAEVVEKDKTPIIVTGIDTFIPTFKESLLKANLHINQHIFSNRIIAIYSYSSLKHSEIFTYETITFVKTITKDGILRYYAILQD